ncbi:MAG: oligosaccharide flippase family protein, partial [Gaiellaceae bacterium]
MSPLERLRKHRLVRDEPDRGRSGSPIQVGAGSDLAASGPEPPARVVANAAWSAFGQGTGMVIGAAVAIYAVRSFSTNSWGHYATALALVTLFSVLASAGLAPLALREMTAATGRQSETLGLVLQSLAWTTCLAVVGLFAIAPVLGYPRQVYLLILILAPLLALNPVLALLSAAFNARSQLVYVAWFQLAQALVYGALAVAVIVGSLEVTGLAAAMVAAALVAAVFGLWLLRTRLTIAPRLKQPPRRAWSLLRAAIPFGAIGVVGIVYDRVDTLMLSVLSNATSVAHYAVPYGFLRLAWIVPYVVSTAFFPSLSRG